MKATIDRIEGSLAVLITLDTPQVVFNLPVSFIDGAHDGDIIDITISRDPESTAAAKEEISALIERLSQKRKGSDK